MRELTPPSRSRSPQSERRIEPRLAAEDVPWILCVRPQSGAAGRLLNISSTGILLESGVRLLPHRKSAVLIETDDRQKERFDATVVRTELIAIMRDTDPIYRSALTFSKKLSGRLQDRIDALLGAHETAVLLEEPIVTAAEPARLELEGPLEALWASEHLSQVTTAWHVTEAGCIARVGGSPAIGHVVSLRIYFSPARHLLLPARVAAILEDGGVAVRFEPLTADDRRALRVELRARAFDPAVDVAELLPSVAKADVPLVHAHVNTTTRSALHANAW